MTSNEVFIAVDSKLNATAKHSEGSRVNVEPTYNKDLIAWRRAKVLEYVSRGHSQREISDILKVSTGTVSEDLKHVLEDARNNKDKLLDRIFVEQYKATNRLDQLLIHLFSLIEGSNDEGAKLQAISLVSEITNQRLDITAGKHLERLDRINAERRR